MIPLAMISRSLWGFLGLTAGLSIVIGTLVSLLEWSASSARRRILKRRREFRIPPAQRESLETQIPWETRFDQADTAIRELIQTLPPQIRKEADRVPYVLEKWPPSGRSHLGLCFSFEPKKVSEAPGPLFIYIGPHHAFCERWNIEFDEEIRRTYLHELGHHLGLDEADLDARGIG